MTCLWRLILPGSNHLFYSTCIRSILECSCQVFHYGLPEYLSLAIERLPKLVLSIIYPSAGSYTDRLQISILDPNGVVRKQMLCGHNMGTGVNVS